MTRTPLKLTMLLLAVVLAGCADKSNTIQLQYDPLLAKTVLSPQKGDVIAWKNGKEELKVTFDPLGNPCKEASPTSVCTINVEKARVPYACKDCEDPEIVVGSDIMSGLAHPTLLRGAPVTRVLVYIACESNQVQLLGGDEVKISAAQVTAGVKLAWAPGGIHQVGDDWKVDNFNPPSICTNTPPFNRDNPICDLKTTTTGTTTYTVSAASCNNSSAPGKITVTP